MAAREEQGRWRQTTANTSGGSSTRAASGEYGCSKFNENIQNMSNFVKFWEAFSTFTFLFLLFLTHFLTQTSLPWV